MRLQKQKAYEYKGKQHSKYTIVLPETLVSEVQWKEGEELKAQAKGKKIIIGQK